MFHQRTSSIVGWPKIQRFVRALLLFQREIIFLEKLEEIVAYLFNECYYFLKYI